DCPCGQDKKSRRFYSDHQSTLVAIGIGSHVRVGSKPEDLKVSVTSRLLGDSDQEAPWHGMLKPAPRRRFKLPNRSLESCATNSPITNGWPSGRSCRTSRAAFRV